MQTSINKAGQPIAVAGQLSDNGEVTDIVSRFNDEATATIPFGVGVKASTAKHGVKVLTAITEIVEGINVWGFNHQPGTNGDLDQTATPPGLKPKAGLQLIRKGRLWAALDPSVSSITPYTDRAFIRAIANGGDNLIGALNKVVDGVTNIDSTKQVQFVSGLQLSADGSKIAEVEVDFTNKP